MANSRMSISKKSMLQKLFPIFIFIGIIACYLQGPSAASGMLSMSRGVHDSSRVGGGMVGEVVGLRIQRVRPSHTRPLTPHEQWKLGYTMRELFVSHGGSLKGSSSQPAQQPRNNSKSTTPRDQMSWSERIGVPPRPHSRK